MSSVKKFKLGSRREFPIYVGNRINPLLKKSIKEGLTSSIKLPDGFVIDKVRKRVISTKNKTGKISAVYKKTLLENPKSIVQNPRNKEIYNATTNRLVPKRFYTTPTNRVKRLYRMMGYIYQDNMVLKKENKFEYNISPLIRRNNGLTISRQYSIPTAYNFSRADLVRDTPTNSNQFINAIKYHLNKDFSVLERSKRQQRLLLKFGNEFRYVPLSFINSPNFGKRLDNWEGQSFGSDVNFGNSNFINSDLLDLSFFRITLHGRTFGGGMERAKLNSKYWKTNQPKTKGNLCFDGAIMVGLKLPLSSKSIRRDMMFFTNNEITFEQTITMNNILDYEDNFECNISIYEDKPHDENCFLESENRYEKDIKILLHNEHYYLISGTKKIIKQSNQLSNEIGDLKLKVKSKDDVLKNKLKLKRKLVIFDIETVFDKNDENYLKTYGVSWVVWDLDNDFNYNKDIHTREPTCYYKKGEGCLEHFIEFLITPPDGEIYKPIGFNNSRFDNFAVCEKASEMGYLRNVFFVDGSILYFVLNGVLPSWDACRFLTGMSLKSACESYNTNPKKASDLIDHYEIQCYYEKFGWEGLNTLLTENKDLVLYNKIDCLCLLDLIIKMRNSYLGLFDFDILESYTLSSMSYKILKEVWETEGIEIHRAETNKIDNFWRASLTAGRTQSFYNKIDIKTPLAMVDVKSLYPTVMGSYGDNDCPFPYGRYEYTKNEVKDVLGIYNVDIIHQRCKWQSENMKERFEMVKRNTGMDLYKEYAPNVIPKRTDDEPLNWFYKDEIKNIKLTSVDIDVLRWATGDFNCVKVYDGYIWRESRKDLFTGFLDPPKNEKTNQDRLKAKRKELKKKYPTYNDIQINRLMLDKYNEDYNEAKREGCKGISNSLSGKLLEAKHTDMCEAFGCKKFLKWDGDKSIKDIDVLDFGRNFSIMTATRDEDKAFESARDKKPAHLGMFVYSYARKLMYQKLISKCIGLYMDTDSLCMPISEYDLMNNDKYNIENDLFENGEYGCLEEEVCEMKWCKKCLEREKRNNRDEIKQYRLNNKMVNGVRCSKCEFIPANRLIGIAPKNYLVENEKADGYSKRKFKGVRKNDFWLPLNYFGDYEIYDKEHNDGSITKQIRGTGYDRITNMSQEQIRRFREFKCCFNCIDKHIYDNENCDECKKYGKLMNKTYSTEMFEYLVRGEKIAVFCSMINRIKYKVKQITDWEFDTLLGRELTIKDFDFIVNNGKDDGSMKTPICFKLKRTLKEDYADKAKAIYNNDKLDDEDKKKQYKKLMKKYVMNDTIEEREITDIFKLKQQFMVKLI